MQAARPAAVACTAVVCAMTFALPAEAAEQLIPVPENGTPGLLRLSSSVYPLEFPALAAGDSFAWQIGLSLAKPQATSTLQLTASGGLAGAGGYVIAVDECASPWEGSSGLNQQLECPPGSTPRIAATTLQAWNQTVRIPLRDLRAGTSPYLRFTLSKPADSPPLEGAALTLGIGITAMGDDDAGSGPSLPPVANGDTPAEEREPLGDTGASSLSALFAGGGLLLLGAALLATMKRSREAPEARESPGQST
ncbi:LPXTG cell wall anchor domain-containing protein [Paenarthrobacter nitroguajacolicus]|uniref:LPXTG cell wall anchor domain-containing protein n=1 Tax=Paenarthrobacter nitroguajacolicus TaxID=211146 RepID=UPI0040544235